MRASHTLRGLIAGGQIATQYVDPDGQPSGDIDWNPNGSVCASRASPPPTAGSLGKMGHSERQGDNLLKNVPGEKDQALFLSGVRYFS